MLATVDAFEATCLAIMILCIMLPLTILASAFTPRPRKDHR